MLDVQSGSLWRYNQPPAEPAFCSSPAAFCPLELSLQPPPLNRICVYNIYSHPSFHPLHFFFISPSSSPVTGGEIYASLPHVVATAAEAEKEKGVNGVNKFKKKKKKRLHKGYPFILLSVTLGMKALFKLIA